MYATFYYVTKLNLFHGGERKKKEFYFFSCFAAVAKMIFGDRNCFQECAVPFVEVLNASEEWLQI